MATTTTNLGLTKPIGTEKALVSVINGNMDIIDNKVGAVPQNESVQSQITALNNQIAKFETNAVSTLPFESGSYYCGTAQTIAGVEIPTYTIYSIHVYSNTAVGYAIRTTNGDMWVFNGTGGSWTNCRKLS